MTTETQTETTATVTETKAKRTRKPRAKKAVPKEPTWASRTGQTGPAIEVSFGDLNLKEQKVLAVLSAQEGRKPLKIAELADLAFSKGAAARRNSWVRNCMRRLTRAGWAEHGEEKGDGTYRLTKNGKDRLRRVEQPKRTKTLPAKPATVEAAVGTTDEAVVESATLSERAAE